jgi:hypothetical protein
LESLGIRDCEINEACGLHIHVSSADLSPLQVAKVLTAWRLLADILDPIAGVHRKRNSYCQDHTYRHRTHWLGKIRGTTVEESCKDFWSN